MHCERDSLQSYDNNWRGVVVTKKMRLLDCVIVLLTGADGWPVGAPAGALAVVDGLAEDAEAPVTLVPHHGAPVQGKRNL